MNTHAYICTKQKRLPYVILSFFYFTQHNNTVHVVFFCTEAFLELVPDTGCGVPTSGQKLTRFPYSFFISFPFKKYQFHKRYIKDFVRFVSVCLCLSTCQEMFVLLGRYERLCVKSPFAGPLQSNANPSSVKPGRVLDPRSITC